MAKRVGIISINLAAGTAQFNADMGKAKASVASFGTAAKAAGAAHVSAGHATVSSMQASSAAIRVMEGGMTNNLRAVERFVAGTLKLGPVLQAAFPLIGGLAFLGLMTKIGTEVYNFFQKMSEGPARVANAFRELNAPLRLTNDELALTNDRLANDIAKLEGKPQNKLAEALDEARVEADRLADALDKDLKAFNELLKQENVSKLGGLVTDQASTGWLKELIGGQAGLGGVRRDIANANKQGREDFDAAKTDVERKNAIALASANLQKIVADAERTIGAKLREAAAAQAVREQGLKNMTPGAAGNVRFLAQHPDQAKAIEMMQGAIEELQQNSTFIDRSMQNAALTNRDNALKGDKEAKPEKTKTDEALRRSQEETNRLLQELAAATERNLSVWDAINLKQQEMMRRALEANVPNKGVVGPGVVPQEQQDLIAQITFQERQAEYTKEFNKGIEEGNRALKERVEAYQKASAEVERLRKQAAEEEFRTQLRLGEIGRDSNRDTLTRKAGLADRMAEMGFGSPEQKINTAYQRRIELAHELDAIQKKSIEEEFAGNNSQVAADDKKIALAKEEADIRKEMYEAEIEREEKLLRLQQERIKELTDPLIDGMSGQLARLMTGQKTSFAKMFQSVGESMAASGLKKAANAGLSALGNTAIGKKLGLGAFGKKDGQSAPTALWVQMAAGASATQSGGAFTHLPPMMPGAPAAAGAGAAAGAAAPSFFKTLAGAFFGGAGGAGGAGASAATESVSSSISFMAGGGDMSADKAYIVGENGPELMHGINAHIMSNSDSRKLVAGGGDVHNWNIDARGADLGAYNRIARGMEATGKASASAAVKAMHEHARRVPAHA